MMPNSLFTSNSEDVEDLFMKRLTHIVCLIVSVALTGYLFVHVSYMYRGYTRLMGFYGLKDNTIDVAFVGTSVTFSTFMPMEAWNEYGMAAYDYCTNVQFENSLRHSIKEVMKTQSPKLLLVDVAPFLSQSSAETTYGEEEQFLKCNIDSMPYSLNRAQLIREINRERQGDLYSYLYYTFDICRYHTNEPSIEQWNNACNDVNRGYGFLPRNEGAVVNMDSLLYDDGAEKPLEGQHAVYLEELLADVDRLDCEVIFYCAPIRFVKEYEDECFRKNYIKRILGERGYVFWDLSTEVETIGLDYEYDFWSYDHFDSLGAEKATKYLAKRILDSYDIPDRRTDPRYADWHEDYQTWIDVKGDYNDQDRQ